MCGNRAVAGSTHMTALFPCELEEKPSGGLTLGVSWNRLGRQFKPV